MYLCAYGDRVRIACQASMKVGTSIIAKDLIPKAYSFPSSCMLALLFALFLPLLEPLPFFARFALEGGLSKSSKSLNCKAKQSMSDQISHFGRYICHELAQQQLSQPERSSSHILIEPIRTLAGRHLHETRQLRTCWKPEMDEARTSLLHQQYRADLPGCRRSWLYMSVNSGPDAAPYAPGQWRRATTERSRNIENSTWQEAKKRKARRRTETVISVLYGGL